MTRSFLAAVREGDPSRILTPASDTPLLSGAFAASITAFFSFLGFEAAANMAEAQRLLASRRSSGKILVDPRH